MQDDIVSRSGCELTLFKRLGRPTNADRAKRARDLDTQPPSIQAARKEIDRVRRHCNRQRRGLMKKANEMRELFSAEVYVCLYVHRKFYTYKSNTAPNWPPPTGELVSSPMKRHVGGLDLN